MLLTLKMKVQDHLKGLIKELAADMKDLNNKINQKSKKSFKLQNNNHSFKTDKADNWELKQQEYQKKVVRNNNN